VTGIHAVKAHAAERTTRDRWEGLFARFIRTGFKASTTSNISNNIGDFLTNFSNLLILWFGATLVISQKLTIGQLVAFQMLSGRMTGPLLRLVQLWQNLQQVLLSVDRIGDILNVAPEAEPGSGLVLPTLKGQVTFDQVFFRYHANQEPILRGISFKVQPGMFVGIVGRSGSGKSTLSKLLQRLYSVESGRILIDGFDIKSADLSSLRQQISVVLQEDFLFNGSILENITLGQSRYHRRTSCRSRSISSRPRLHQRTTSRLRKPCRRARYSLVWRTAAKNFFSSSFPFASPDFNSRRSH
jgi:ATP-binding cassette subfamily B protein